MKLAPRSFAVAAVLSTASMLGVACSSEPQTPSVSAEEAVTRCHDLVIEEYAKVQRPPEYDSETTTQEGDAWKVSGMVRGTKPVEIDAGGNPVGDERTSKDMAHMKFDCTVTDETTSLDTWRLANPQDIADAEALAESTE